MESRARSPSAESPPGTPRITVPVPQTTPVQPTILRQVIPRAWLLSMPLSSLRATRECRIVRCLDEPNWKSVAPTSGTQRERRRLAI